MATASLNMGVPNFIDRDFTKLTDARVLRDLLPMLPNINLLDLLGQHDGRWGKSSWSLLSRNHAHVCTLCHCKPATASCRRLRGKHILQ